MFDSFFADYPQYEYMFARIQLILFMLAMGATLSMGDFVKVFRHPRSLGVATIIHLCVIPLLAVLVNWVGGLEPGIAVGLILVATMPGGTLSKLFTYIGRGNLALSITMSGCFTLGAIVTVPFLLRLLAFRYIPDEFQMPVGWIVRDVFCYLVLPLLGGMVVSRFLSEHRLVFARWCVRIGFVFVFAMIIGSLGSGRIQVFEYGWRAPLAIILFCLLAQQVSMLPFRIMGWKAADLVAVGIEMTMRNINLALLLKALLFPAIKGVDPIADGVLFVVLFYAGTAFFFGTPLALRFRFYVMNGNEKSRPKRKTEAKLPISA